MNQNDTKTTKAGARTRIKSAEFSRVCEERDELLAACKAWEYARKEGGISMVDWFNIAWEKTSAAIAKARRAGAMKRTVLTLLFAANCFAGGTKDNTFEARETELHAFERHDAELLAVDRPLYRLGETLKLNE